MSRERESQLQSSLLERSSVSLDLKQIRELLTIRFERYKNDLVSNESDQVRGRAKELKDLLKILSTVGLDNAA